MIGQINLIEKLNNFTYETLPQTIMFVGKKGCGKHTVINMLSTKFNVEIKNISNKLNYEQVIEYNLNVNPCFYLIDKKLNINEQNSLLKFIEEPPTISKIIILTENENCLLETIIGRCQKFVFEKYSKEELKQFVNDDELLNYVETPGEILSFKNNSDWVFELCDSILTKIDFANIPNILTISNKLNFENDDGFDIDVFMKILITKCFNYIGKNEKYFKAYFTLKTFYDKMNIVNVDKQKLFELCLLQLKIDLRNEHTGT